MEKELAEVTGIEYEAYLDRILTEISGDFEPIVGKNKETLLLLKHQTIHQHRIASALEKIASCVIQGKHFNEFVVGGTIGTIEP